MKSAFFSCFPLTPAPLFTWAFWLLLGSGSALYPPVWIYTFFLFLFFSWKEPFLRPLSSLCLILVGFGYTYGAISGLPKEEKSLQGFAHLQIKSIAPFSSFFQKSYLVKGTLLSFHEKEGDFYHHIPCLLFTQNPPSPNSDWLMKGTLSQKGDYRFVFKPDLKIPFTSIKHSFSFKQWRFKIKEKIRNSFRKKPYEERVSSFFSSTLTGDPDNKLLSMEFYKVGLGHILAISGFHFALLAVTLRFFLRFLFRKWADLLLLALLSLYFLFLGASPSALRAFIMIGLYLLGSVLRKESSGLNLLGAACLIEWSLDPLALTHLGFQLTFLATFGLIFFYRPVDQLLQLFSPLRPFSFLKTRPLFEQCAYLILSFIRKGFAIDLSITLTTLPLTLFIFKGYFSLATFYNLIIPPLLSISIALLPFGLVLSPLEWMNAHYTGFILKLLANPPQILQHMVSISSMPLPLLLPFVLLPLSFAVYHNKKETPQLFY